MVAVTTVLVIIIVWSAVSSPLDRRGITSALFFVVVGFLVALLLPHVLDIRLEALAAERIAEVGLALLLFSDATRLNLRALRSQLSWPTRLLLIGLPLSILVGFGIGLVVFPGIAVASAFLLATMLAPTDAALGQKVISDTSVPPRVRQALDVESGLNDGLGVPFFLVALAIANAELETGFTTAVFTNMALQIGWGVAAGLAAGMFGGLLFRLGDRQGWIAADWRQILALVSALLSYAIAFQLGGSVFIAAFVGGITFGYTVGPVRSVVSMLAEQAGDLLAAITWIAFGAFALSLAIPHITWQVVVYAILSLTVVRMLPVAIALAGRGARMQTVAFIGWFGPRGLASLVFALLALERGIPEAEVVLTTVVVTVALSILLHGLSSVPLVAAYHRWYSAHSSRTPDAAEAVSTIVPRRRREIPGAARAEEA
ncbi:cation:proton antiporter [Microbacterium sp. NPDC076911]|uniref:cation:proton antiporter n=1 Tax=Microbacterium sp. NPDC076911 TaxID=3154958 RepID=UPI003424E549